MTVNPMNSSAYRGLNYGGENLIHVNRGRELTDVVVPEPDLGGYMIPDEGHDPCSIASMIKINTLTCPLPDQRTNGNELAIDN